MTEKGSSTKYMQMKDDVQRASCTQSAALWVEIRIVSRGARLQTLGTQSTPCPSRNVPSLHTIFAVNTVAASSTRSQAFYFDHTVADALAVLCTLSCLESNYLF